MTRILNFFSVFLNVLFDLPALNQWAFERFRNLLDKPECDLDHVAEARAFTDDQIFQVLALAGAAILMGGLRKTFALEYAIKAVVNGEAITPTMQWMRSLSTLRNPKSNHAVQITWDMTFEQFQAEMIQDSEYFAAMEKTGKRGENKARELFAERQQEIIKGLNDLRGEVTRAELEHLDWQTAEIPAAPETAADDEILKHPFVQFMLQDEDLPQGLRDTLKELLTK